MFTDSCPSCCTRGIAPSATRRRGESIVHGYRCPSCGRTWATSRLLPAYSDIHRRAAARPHRRAA